MPPTEATTPEAVADSGAAPAPRRSRGFGVSTWLPPALTAAAGVVLLQVLVASGVISESALPLPTDVAVAFADVIQDGGFWTAIGQTTKDWALGMGLAIGLAVPLGALAGMNDFIGRSTQFLVDFLRPIPPVALLPLIVLVVGIGSTIAVWEAALGAFFPLFFATVYGVRDRDPVTDDTARVYGLGRWMHFRYVVLPGAGAYLATGLRISAAIALLLVVGTEMVIGIPGLGREIVDAQNAADAPTTYALVVASGLLGVLITAIFRGIEKRVLHWHPSQRGSA